MMEMRQAYLWFFVPGLIFVDLVTKLWARATLVPPVLDLDLGPFLGLQLAENPGATFGLLSFGDGPGWIIPMLVTMGLATGVGVWLVRAKSDWRRVFVGLIFGGAWGNIADRMINGGVTDFLVYRWWGEPLFIGNIADIWITVGAIGAFGGMLISGPGNRQTLQVAKGD
jgi:signal peptidase II